MQPLQNSTNSSSNRKVKRRPCVIPFCKSLPVSVNEKTSYFTIRPEWSPMIREALGNKVPECEKICSRHFKNEDMFQTDSRVYVKQNAVPTQKLQQVIRPLPEPEELFFQVSPAQHSSPSPPCSFLYSSDNVPSIPENSNSSPGIETSASLQNFPVSNLNLVSSEEPISSDNPTLTSTSSGKEVKKKKFATRRDVSTSSKPNKGQASSSSSRRSLSPTSILKQKVETLEKKLEETQKKFYCSNRKVKRLEEKLSKEKQIINDMKSKLKVSTEVANTVSNMSLTFQALFEAEKMKQKLTSTKGMRYTDDLKKIAVTLYQYSPKCYEYLRQSFTLPDKSSIRDWVSSENCDPGYNIDFLNRLQDYLADKYFNYSDMVLVFDEMSLRKCIRYCKYSRQFFGHVNYGAEDTPDTDLPLASNVCVAMAVSLSGGWKMPIGYIFTAGVNKEILTRFVEKGINLMQERGMRIHGVVTDSHETNVSMFKSFGAHRENAEGFKFTKPGFEEICAIFDMCHLIKNWRGAFFECGRLYFPDGSVADSNFVLELHKLQQRSGIRAANNINNQVINYKQNIMKTRFAFKVFSKSCADGIEFASKCKEDGHLFKGCERTVSFIRKMNRVIDILNSKNPYQKFDKSPIKLEFSTNQNNDLNSVKRFLEEFISEISQIEIEELKSVKQVDSSGKESKVQKPTGKRTLLVKSARKGMVLGLTTTIRSIMFISEKLLRRSQHPFFYVMTYRFSSDHIELFFAKCRNSLGNNNNPTCQEFIRIMRYFWHGSLFLSCGTGNALVRNVEEKLDSILLPLQRQLKKKENVEEKLSEDGLKITSSFNLLDRGEFFAGSLTYICGYVIKALEDKLNCAHCLELLPHSPEDPVSHADRKLINIRDFGGLKFPSNSCLLICKIADQLFMEEINKYKFAPTVKNFEGVIVRKVLSSLVNYNIFPSATAKSHFLNFCPASEEGHQTILIRAIVRQLIIVRGYDFGNRFTKDGDSTRRKYNKLNVFKESTGQKDFRPFKDLL